MISVNENLQSWERDLLALDASNPIRTIPASEEVAPRSGYTPCACRDCMDVTVSSDTSKPELCEECKEAGCVAIAPYNERVQFCTAYECQRGDAYDACTCADDDELDCYEHGQS